MGNVNDIRDLLYTAPEDVGSSLSFDMLNFTGVDGICKIFAAGFGVSDIAKALNTNNYNIYEYINKLNDKDRRKVRDMERLHHKDELHTLASLLKEDIRMQYNVDAEGKEVGELIEEQMKLAMLVEKRANNATKAIGVHERALARLDKLLDEGKKKDEGTVIEHNVIISNNALNYLPDA